MHMFVALSIDIITRLVDEHELMQELGEALWNIELVESLSPPHSQWLKKFMIKDVRLDSLIMYINFMGK